MKIAIMLGVLLLFTGGSALAGSMPVTCEGKKYNLFFEHYNRDAWSPLPVETVFTERVDGGSDRTVRVIRRTKRGGYLVLVAKKLVALYFGYKKSTYRKHVVVYRRDSGEVLELIKCSK